MRHVLLGVIAVMLCASVGLAEEGEILIGKEKRWREPRPNKPDLTVIYIKRLPRYPGTVVKYNTVDHRPDGNEGPILPPVVSNPDAQKWPKPGEVVTFHAHVKNKGPVTVESYDWHWLIDGKDVKSGRGGPIKFEQEHVYELKWKWQKGPHYVAFEVDRARVLDEITRNNNFVVDRTDALSFHFFVEKSLYKWFNTVRNGMGSYCWEDWAQYQIREMNRMFRDSIYPSTPAGIIERVRIDEITIIPDGWGSKGGMHVPNVKLPIDVNNPVFVSANANVENSKTYTNGDGGVDGVWGFTVDLLKPDKNGLNFYTRAHRWLTGPEWPLHHELGHQLGRADHYLTPISPSRNRAAPGMGYDCPQFFRDSMMFSGNYVHDDNIGKHRKKWDCTYRFYDEYTSASLNRDKGVRRGMFGEYCIDVPTQNTFTFVDKQGKPIRNAEVELHRSVGQGYANGFISAKAAYTGKTDDKGRWTVTGPIYSEQICWMTNTAIFFLLRQSDGKRLGGFTDVSELNLEYWRGHHSDANVTIVVRPVPVYPKAK